MIRPLVVGLALALAACAGPEPPTPVLVCPPDPPAGSGFQCAPPPPSKACQLDPKFVALVEGPLGDLVPGKYQKYRDALDHLGLAVKDLCQ